MTVDDKITRYSVAVFHGNVTGDISRQIRLDLESGQTATISFIGTLPADWLQFFHDATSLYLTADQFTDVYHLLQTSSPAYFTALEFEGAMVGSVHTDFGPGVRGGVATGVGAPGVSRDPNSLYALIQRARAGMGLKK